MSGRIEQPDGPSASGEADPPASPAPAAETARPGSQSLRRRALGGSAWTLLGYGLSNVLRLAGNVVFGYFLFPAAFGVMNLVNLVIQGLWLFTDLGIAPSVVQSPRGDDPAFLRTAWSIQQTRGLLLTLACALLARPVAAFYETPELTWFLPVAGLAAVVDGAASIRLYTRRRHLGLKAITLVDLGAQVGALVVMVAWVVVSPSIWALVVGGVARSLIRTTLSHLALSGPASGFAWDREAARELFRFGRWVFLSTLLTFLAMQCDRMVFGKVFPMDQFGLYGIAASLALLPTETLTKLGSAVVFPVFSRLGPDGLRAGFRRVRAPLLTLGGAIAAALVAAGSPLIQVLYDPRYEGAGWMLGLLSAAAWLKILEVPNNAAILSLGRSNYTAANNLARLVALALLIPLGLSQGGLPGALLGLAGADAIKYLLSLALTRRLGVADRASLLEDLGLTLLLAAGVGLGLGARWGLEALGAHEVLVLVGAGLAALVPWVPLGARLVRQAFPRR